MDEFNQFNDLLAMNERMMMMIHLLNSFDHHFIKNSNASENSC